MRVGKKLTGVEEGGGGGGLRGEGGGDHPEAAGSVHGLLGGPTQQSPSEWINQAPACREPSCPRGCLHGIEPIPGATTRDVKETGNAEKLLPSVMIDDHRNTSLTYNKTLRL